MEADYPISSSQTGLFESGGRVDVLDREAVLAHQALGDQRAVAGLGVALYAEQGGAAAFRRELGDRREVGTIEDLPFVAARELWGEDGA
jgi:hypothetical protein